MYRYIIKSTYNLQCECFIRVLAVFTVFRVWKPLRQKKTSSASDAKPKKWTSDNFSMFLIKGVSVIFLFWRWKNLVAAWASPAVAYWIRWWYLKNQNCWLQHQLKCFFLGIGDRCIVFFSTAWLACSLFNNTFTIWGTCHSCWRCSQSQMVAKA